MLLALFSILKGRRNARGRSAHVRQDFMDRVFIHADSLYRYALRLTGDEHSASDLVQETLTKAFVAFERLGPDANHRAWIFTIARNTFVSAQRRAGRLEELSDPHNVPSRDPDVLRTIAGPHDNYRHAFDDEVLAAIHELSETQRTAVVLCDIEGMSYDEIAAVMGCPVGTIRSRIHHGRKRLRALLAGTEHARRVRIGR